jgi:dTDP-4-dehydrorhamnose reductase
MNSTTPLNILIVGSDGQLGKAFENYFLEQKISFAKTSRRKDKPDCAYLDLSRPPFKWPEINWAQINYALIFASIPKIGFCEEFPTQTQLVNVEATQALIDQCIQNSVIPIFASSDVVFSGEGEYYREDSDPGPVNQYGQQKLAIENYLKTQYKSEQYLVIRLSKVYDLNPKRPSIFNEMAEKMASGTHLTEAHDQIFCPIWIKDVLKSVHQLLIHKAHGFYNLCGEKAWSRYDMAILLAKLLEADVSLVEKKSIDLIDSKSKRPHNTSMSTEKIRSLIQSNFLTVEEALSQVAKNWKSMIKERRIPS